MPSLTTSENIWSSRIGAFYARVTRPFRSAIQHIVGGAGPSTGGDDEPRTHYEIQQMHPSGGWGRPFTAEEPLVFDKPPDHPAPSQTVHGSDGKFRCVECVGEAWGETIWTYTTPHADLFNTVWREIQRRNEAAEKAAEDAGSASADRDGFEDHVLEAVLEGDLAAGEADMEAAEQSLDARYGIAEGESP